MKRLTSINPRKQGVKPDQSFSLVLNFSPLIIEEMTTLEILKSKLPSLSSKSVTLGFDGFIDNVIKVIRNKDHQDSPSYFESTKELGEYIIEKGEKSFSIELEELTTKIGGNVPITANALAHIGAHVSCIGSLGYPSIHPAFRQMPSNCHLYSFAEPGSSNVLEFKTGKMMLAEMKSLNKISWEFILETIGTQTILELFGKSDLVALLNWSELDNSTGVWKGLLKDILPQLKDRKRSVGFFDLSDCSRRSDDSIREAIKLLKGFSEYWDVVLSLNLNEATIIHSVLTRKKEDDVKKMCEEIYDNLNISMVVIHFAKGSVARNKNGLHAGKSFLVANPAISTGAGDNFNAGFSAGMLMNLDVESSLTLGHATSSSYMRSGQSPTPDELLEFLSGNL
jgi:sugar/nucleoside kinase (ribokinase family)